MGAPSSLSLKKIASGDLCAGCGGCAALAPGAITMTQTPPGYLRPEQTAPISAETEAAIAAICPGLGQTVEAQGRTDDALWGPYLEMQTGHSTDSEIRYHGSSGGGLSQVLAWLLETGQIDGAVENTAALDHPQANATIQTEDREGVLSAAGSRYAPSAPLAGLAPYLEGTGRYAFVGKPCDVTALRAWSRIDPRIDARFPIKLSFFCAGVPSLTGAEAVLSELGTTLEDTASFRYRGQGWPGRATAVAHDGTSRDMSYHDSWGKILSRHVQHRCKVCADGTGVDADLVCADAWESDENGYPIFEEQDGTSLFVMRTQMGKTLFEGARAAGKIETQDFDVTKLVHIQPGQRRRRRALLARLAGLKTAGRPVPRYRGLKLREAAGQNGLKENLRNYLGIIKRSLAR